MRRPRVVGMVEDRMWLVVVVGEWNISSNSPQITSFIWVLGNDPYFTAFKRFIQGAVRMAGLDWLISPVTASATLAVRLE